jgi:perosamine synthetase
MPRFVPPAGTPLKISQVLRALKLELSSNGSVNGCLTTVASRLQMKYVFGASSGRAALWLVLKSFKHLAPDRDVVALPAYTCFSVAAAVVRAGLKIHPVDIDPQTLDFDFPQLDAVPEERLLCIVTSNLFGFVNDLPRIQRAAQSKGAFVLDDAAQALSATRDGKLAGTLGDVGVFSLDRGKAVAAMEGGLIVTNSEQIAQFIKKESLNLDSPSSTHSAWLGLQMLIYPALLQPRFFWIPKSLPFLKLGLTEFNPAFPTEKLYPLCQALLPQLLDEVTGVNQIRQKNAKAITQLLEGKSNFNFPKPALNSEATFVRLPVIASDNLCRERAVSRLRGAGIGATSFYPAAICDIEGIEAHMSTGDFHRPKAELLSRTLLTLPVHPLICPQDVAQMVSILSTS